MLKKRTKKKPRPRHIWAIAPLTRIKQSKKKYRRARERARMRKDLNQH